jgi:nucleoside-diphosphate-sugar epimerase
MLSHIKVGAGMDCPIRELAEAIAEVRGIKGTLVLTPENRTDAQETAV